MLDQFDILVGKESFKRFSVSIRSDGRLDWSYGNPDGSFLTGVSGTFSSAIADAQERVGRYSSHRDSGPRRVRGADTGGPARAVRPTAPPIDLLSDLL